MFTDISTKGASACKESSLKLSRLLRGPLDSISRACNTVEGIGENSRRECQDYQKVIKSIRPDLEECQKLWQELPYRIQPPHYGQVKEDSRHTIARALTRVVKRANEMLAVGLMSKSSMAIAYPLYLSSEYATPAWGLK